TVDSKGDVWFISNHGGVNRYSPRAAAGEAAWRFYDVAPADSQPWSSDAEPEVATDGVGGVWVRNQWNVYRYDPATDGWSRFTGPPSLARSISLAARGDDVW